MYVLSLYESYTGLSYLHLKFKTTTVGQATGEKAPPPRPSDATEPRTSARGRRPARSTAHTPSHRRLRSPPPSRQPTPSSASSYVSASPSIPPIAKWTVASLRQALANSDVRFSRRMSKAELYSLYISLEHTNTPSKTSRTCKNKTLHVSGTSSSRSSSSPPRSKRNSRPSASRGCAPDSALPNPVLPHSSAQPDATAPSGTALPATSHTNIPHHPFFFLSCF
ncbi:hypothetical protein G5714_011788 [Onychostoma macrolepis]|uniref:Uncharacterized protein n=1 Tax=Onychostoma macrolepis TaxID=369639 RepID=A0A7J6CJX0_9TELE|nr:hypothetical protein G5714_011788 [Onychostoma macrolepis]